MNLIKDLIKVFDSKYEWLSYSKLLKELSKEDSKNVNITLKPKSNNPKFKSIFGHYVKIKLDTSKDIETQILNIFNGQDYKPKNVESLIYQIN